MELDMLDGTDDDKHSSAGFVEISKVFLTQDAFSFRTEPFDRVLLRLDFSMLLPDSTILNWYSLESGITMDNFSLWMWARRGVTWKRHIRGQKTSSCITSFWNTTIRLAHLWSVWSSTSSTQTCPNDFFTRLVTLTSLHILHFVQWHQQHFNQNEEHNPKTSLAGHAKVCICLNSR